MNPKRILAAASLLACLPLLAAASGTAPKRISGSFELVMTPDGKSEHQGRTTISRMLLEKQYSGDLSAIAKGQMMTAVTDAAGSAAYVAMERISGTLGGKKGSFVIQHTGAMRAGKQQLTISIVPDSGTEQLSGITGSMVIRMEARKHFYDLEYILPEE